MSEPKILQSVGSWQAGAKNLKVDIETVQELLEAASRKTGKSTYDPKGIDGKIARPPRTSNTVKAIKAFQASFMRNPDLVIEPGKNTFQKLSAYYDGTEAFLSSPLLAPVIAMGTAVSDAAGVLGNLVGLGEKPSFPLKFVPSEKYSGANKGSRWFGARRHRWSHRRGHPDRKWVGFRRHAGCDLIAPVGTHVCAVSKGEVLNNPRRFYLTSQYIVVQHEGFQIRYCEFAPGTCKLRRGDSVEQGQKIGEVAMLTNSHMLHLEMYSGQGTSGWSVGQTPTRTMANAPYCRRSDVINPAPYLQKWESNLPT